MTTKAEQILSRFGRKPSEAMILVDIQNQRLALYQQGKVIKSWPISSASKGTGNRKNSYQTPLGTHCISEKFGQDAPTGTIFQGRKNTGQIAEILEAPVVGSEDLVTTRILWLDGMEPGINAGGDVDSHDRYIYIHGTPEEGLIGTPASHGCIRMKNEDIIDLFEQVEISTLVHIEA